MSEFTKRRIIKDLIDEISEIDATTLEIVGHHALEHLEGKTLVQRGINKDYRPVGHTVDTFDQEHTVVGEYSTEADYFKSTDKTSTSDPFPKIAKDVKHALAQCAPAQPQRIYLISTNEEPPSFRSKFQKTALAQTHGHALVFLDARELAKTLYQSAQNNSQLADIYRHYFPDFSQNLDNYEYYGLIPSPCPDHHADKAVRQAIHSHFQTTQPICVLHGISGSGKTQAAIDYTNATIQDYENYIWILGDDWKQGTPLTSIKRTRGGSAINVAGLFNSSKTLLVIDNLAREACPKDFSELQRGLSSGGHVLITSQLGNPQSDIHLHMPALSADIGHRILGEPPDSDNQTLTRIVELCRSAPLILAVTREVSKLDGVDKQHLLQEVVDNPRSITGQDGASIMARILERLDPEHRKALTKIAKSGCTTFDSRFLTFYIGANARAALQRLAIVHRAGAVPTLSVHDLICAATHKGTPESSELVAELERYVAKHCGDMLPSVLRQIHLAASPLLAEHRTRGNRRPDWLTYAILQMNREPHATLIDELQARELDTSMELAELLCIVDSKEAHSYTLPANDRTAYYQQCAADYASLATKTTDAEVRAEMLHHQGKSLRRCDQPDKAMACFESLLSAKPSWHATHGQLAHLGSQKNATDAAKVKGEDSLRSLVRDMLADMYSLPLRVSLAAISRLRSYRSVRNEIASQTETVATLSNIVALAAIEGLDQFYEAYLSLTSLFGYRHGPACLAAADAFPDMLAIYPNTVSRRQWVNACETLTNAAQVAKREGNHPLAKSMLETATAFAKQIPLADSNSYKCRVVAKCFLANHDGQGALSAIAHVDNDSRDHWLLYLQAKAELALDDHRSATTSATRALNLAQKDPKAADRISIYHDQLSIIREAANDTETATAHARDALDSARDDVYRKQLAERLGALEQHGKSKPQAHGKQAEPDPPA